MKRLYRAILFFLCFLFFAFPASAKAKETLCLVSLGDSIPNGYGLADTDLPYPKLIADRLGAEGIYLEKDGLTSMGLLENIRGGLYDESLRKADVIFLSVGGNDFLSRISGEAAVSLLEGNIVKMSRIANEGIAALEKSLPEILSALRDRAGEAVILVQTVYNPYRSFGAFRVGNVVFSKYFDTYIEKLNDVIRAEAGKTNGVLLCEVYEAFEGAADDRFVNALPKPLNVDPHPTHRGHLAIADAMWATLLENNIISPDGQEGFLPAEKEENSGDEIPLDPPPTNDVPTNDPSDKDLTDGKSAWLPIAFGVLLLLAFSFLFVKLRKK